MDDDRQPTTKVASTLKISLAVHILTAFSLLNTLVLSSCGCDSKNSWKTAPEGGPEPTRMEVAPCAILLSISP